VKKKHRTGKNIYIFLVFLFLYLPIAVLFLYSFNTSRMNIVWQGFTLKWYGSFFKNQPLMTSLYNSLVIAVLTTVISTVVGTIGAVGLNRYDFPGKKLIDDLLYIPIVIPEIVLGISLLSIYSLMSMELGLVSIMLSHVTFCIPFVLVNVRARIAGSDRSQEEAAMDLGANRLKTFLRVTLPELLPGVWSGAILSFTLSMDDVVISFFTTGPECTTLPLKIFSMVKTGVTPEVNALSAVIMFVTIVIISVYTQMQIRKMKKKQIKAE
jgi:spermidine/putrescine transport system permease protein